jgi:putative flippase GtrA
MGPVGDEFTSYDPYSLNRLMGNPKKQKLRFLIVGAWNTAFGYAVTVLLYQALATELHVALIGMLANILGITMSFLTYKTLVFRTKGHWFREYVKAYVVYGINAVMSILLLWGFVKGLGWSIYLAQLAVTILTVVIAYLGHSRWTFSRN